MSKDLVISPKIEKLSAVFDRDYFENGVATKRATTRTIHGNGGSQFQRTATHCRLIQAQRTLDVGCAKGLIKH